MVFFPICDWRLFKPHPMHQRLPRPLRKRLLPPRPHPLRPPRHRLPRQSPNRKAANASRKATDLNRSIVPALKKAFVEWTSSRRLGRGFSLVQFVQALADVGCFERSDSKTAKFEVTRPIHLPVRTKFGAMRVAFFEEALIHSRRLL